MSRGYEIVSLDELERCPTPGDSQLLLPLRRRLGFRPFGVNAWLGERAGDRVIERHREPDGVEELYVVLRGRARFALGHETFDAPVGMLVHARPGTVREAFAAEDGTIVLAAGARAGEAFSPAAWEDVRIAFARLRAGDEAGGRAVMNEALGRSPGAWEGAYDRACFEALAGNPDAALEWLRRAVAGGGRRAVDLARADTDFDTLRSDERFAELTG